jgi:hypothetical protein
VQHGPRTFDYFHLAAAFIRCKEQPCGRLFGCCYARLAEAATKAGFDVLP